MGMHSPPVGSIAQHPQQPIQPAVGATYVSEQEHELQERNEKLKYKIRTLRLISRMAATVIAIATASQEGETLETYRTTHDIQRGGRGPWAKQTQLWPAIMLFSASSLTAIFGVLIMAAYIRSFSAANRINSINTSITLSIEIIHVMVWIVIASLYRYGKNEHDLWGWACSPLAANIQPNFQGIVNFDTVCKRGSRNWALSIATPTIAAFNLTILYFAFRRKRVQTHLQKEAEAATPLTPGF